MQSEKSQLELSAPGADGFHVYLVKDLPPAIVRIVGPEADGYNLLRFRLFEGKGPEGFCKRYLRDPLYFEIDDWNRRYGFERLEFCPSAWILEGRAALKPHLPEPAKSGSLEKVHRIMTRCLEAKKDRTRVKGRVNGIHEAYQAEDRERIEARYATIERNYFALGYVPKTADGARAQEIKRQELYNLHCAVMLAWDHLAKMQDIDGGANRNAVEAIRERELFLLEEALKLSADPSIWNGVSELFDTPTFVNEYIESHELKSWEETSKKQKAIFEQLLEGADFDTAKICAGISSEVPPIPVAGVASEKAHVVHTNSQALALDQLESLAGAYFSGAGRELPFKPRYNALLVAPTGSGKTKLAADLATGTEAVLHVVSLGEWIVLGAYHQPATITLLLRAIQAAPRVVLLLDEIDKFSLATESAWMRYCAAEIWAVLDRRLPLDDFCARSTGGKELRGLLKDRIENGLYIIGAGTFQRIWEASERRNCGFHDSSSTGLTDTEIITAIRKDGVVSPELLSRFSPKPILLRYPTLVETVDLLEKLGLNQLAKEAGVVIAPDSIEYDGVGMRALEQLGASLLVARREKQMRAQTDLFIEKIRRLPATTEGEPGNEVSTGPI